MNFAKSLGTSPVAASAECTNCFIYKMFYSFRLEIKDENYIVFYCI